MATWRDGFVLFQDFATAQLHKQPTTMKLPDITPSLIRAFLDHLARDRGNAVRTLCVPCVYPSCPAGGAARVPQVRGAPRRGRAAYR